MKATVEMARAARRRFYGLASGSNDKRWKSIVQAALDAAPREVNVAQAARIAGVHPNTIRNWAHAGKVPYTRLPESGYLRFNAADIERLRK